MLIAVCGGLWMMTRMALLLFTSNRCICKKASILARGKYVDWSVQTYRVNGLDRQLVADPEISRKKREHLKRHRLLDCAKFGCPLSSVLPLTSPSASNVLASPRRARYPGHTRWIIWFLLDVNPEKHRNVLVYLLLDF